MDDEPTTKPEEQIRHEDVLEAIRNLMFHYGVFKSLDIPSLAQLFTPTS